MSEYKVYPAVDAEHQFPPEVRQAIVDSPEVSSTFITAELANSIFSEKTDNGEKPIGKNEQLVNVRDFGALGNPEIDDSPAIQSAIDYAKSKGLLVVASGEFRIDSPVVINCNADFNNATLTYYKSDGIALTITGSRITVKAPRMIQGLKTFGGGWSGVISSIGVRLYNTLGCDISIPFVQNFGQGLSCYGEDTGCAYNTVHLGWLFNNRRNQVCDTSNVQGTGYSNQNTYVGGRMSHHAIEGTNITGVYNLYTTGSGDGGPNNNTWLNTCFEGDQPQWSINLERARYNIFINPRLEYGNAIRFGAAADRNELIGGYGTTGITVIRVPGEKANTIRTAIREDLYDKNISMFGAGKENPWFVQDTASAGLGLGNGTSLPTFMYGYSGGVDLDGSLRPKTTATYDLGSPTFSWRNLILSGTATIGVAADLKVASPGAPVEGARLFARLNGGTNKTELCVRFSSGVVIVLATQP